MDRRRLVLGAVNVAGEGGERTNHAVRGLRVCHQIRAVWRDDDWLGPLGDERRSRLSRVVSTGLM
jgi:hypothetical protein